MKTTRPRRWRRFWPVPFVVLALAALLIALLGRGSTSQRPLMEALPSGNPSSGPCAAWATQPFVPTSITIPGVVSDATVLAEPRDANGVPRTVPLTDAGKHQFAWDEAPVGLMPGSMQGNVLFNAHTWPWPAGGALGNQLLTSLHVGGILVVSGAETTQCYRVTKQVEVDPRAGYPPYFDRTGPAQIAVLVCSGDRLGPDNWSKRTIWFATPYVGAA